MSEDQNSDFTPLLESMLPHLPSVEDQVMSPGGDGFEDRILLLLSAVANADGLLSYPEYELTSNIVREIFGERALNAQMQARFHFALLNPPANPEQLASSLAAESVREQVSGQQIQALLDGLDELGRNAPKLGKMAAQLRESIDIVFAQERLDDRRRDLASKSGFSAGFSSGLEQSAKFSLNVGKAAVDGTVNLVQNVFEAARHVLPGQKDKSPDQAVFHPPVIEFNRQMAEQVDALSKTAWTLGEQHLLGELADFKSILIDQPFRVVFVGEGKRGKSSLINALLGDNLSPVRESVPETSAVAEFHYAPLPEYQVSFLDEESYANLDAYLSGEEDNILLQRKIEYLRSLTPDQRPRGSSLITSRQDIPEYLSADGRYSPFVAQVSLGLPLDILAQGLILVDTPGLNATDSFHDYLAYEESLKADCLVFVLDARRPDSASELRLLRKLAAAGRAVSIIGVLTGSDRLNSEQSVSLAESRALDFLREATRGAPELNVLGLVRINAREAMSLAAGDLKGSGREQAVSGLNQLFDLLARAMQLDRNKQLYRQKIKARSLQLSAQTRLTSHEALERYRASLPPAQFLELLERHSEQLAESARQYAEQARSVVAAAAHDVEEWRLAQERELDDWEEKLVLRVMDAARRKADQLGNGFAKESAWQEFDEQEAPQIARQSLDEFLARQQESLYAWNEKIGYFDSELRELSVLCLQAVEESARELGDICSTSGGIDHLLVQTNAHMRRLAVFLVGAGAGSIVTAGLVNLVALGSAAFILLTNPIVLPGAALIGVAAYALQSLGNLEKRKAAFLERKEKKTRKWAAEVRQILANELEAARRELAGTYKSAVSRGFVPALEILVGEAVHLNLYLQTMDKIRDDTDSFERKLEQVLENLEG